MKLQSQPSKFVKRDSNDCGYINILCDGDGCNSFNLNQQISISCGDFNDQQPEPIVQEDDHHKKSVDSNWQLQLSSSEIIHLKPETQDDGTTKVIIELSS